MEKNLYIKELENGLMNALDEIIIYHKLLGKNYDNYNKLDLEQYNMLMFENIGGEIVKKDIDYYDKLRELTNWCNFQALEFLEKFGDNDDE
jgi:hypothetical protein